jgi:Zn-finger nucleic acid-binding protein
LDTVCLGCGERDEACACTRLQPYRDVEPVSRQHGNCPRCARELIAEDYADTPLDECAQCGGIFVDGWILDRLSAAREARISLSLSLPDRRLHRENVVRYLRCPRCTQQMNRKIFGRSSGIVVDVCKEHGMWFDAGELAAVIEFIEGGGLERAKKRADEERAEEARRQKTQRAVAMNAPVLSNTRGDLAAEFVRALVEWWK